MNYRTDADYKAVADHIPVYCAHDKIVDIKELTPNPKNPNTHPDSQIELLADIIEQVGWRAPITVSTASGYVVKGHGRLMAAKHKGCIVGSCDDRIGVSSLKLIKIHRYAMLSQESAHLSITHNS